MSSISSFKSIENKHAWCRGKDCMKKFCEFLQEHEIKITKFKKKKMKSLTKELPKSYENAYIIFVKKNLKINFSKIKMFVKLEIIVIIQGNIEIVHIAYLI